MNDNQFGVILESILDKVEVIAEGQRNLDDKVNNLTTGQQKIEKRLDHVENKLICVEERLTHVEDRLTCVEDRLTHVEKEVKGLKTETHIVKSFVMRMEKGINDHEVRINKLEQNTIAQNQ